MKKEKQFHGDYYLPGQIKHPDKFSNSTKILAWILLAAIAMLLALIIWNIF